MSEYDRLARVRNDLETMESAIGLSRSWNPSEVRLNLLFAAAGLAAILWLIVPHGLMPVLGLCFFAIPIAEWAQFVATHSTEDRFIRRDFKSALRTFWLLVPLLSLFLWCQHFGLAPLEFLGLATFLVGVVLFSAAVGERFERSLLAWSVPLMCGGLVLPLEVVPFAAVLAAALGLGGLMSAGLAFAARKDFSNHAST